MFCYIVGSWGTKSGFGSLLDVGQWLFECLCRFFEDEYCFFYPGFPWGVILAACVFPAWCCETHPHPMASFVDHKQQAP
jgi:hypothetical protein